MLVWLSETRIGVYLANVLYTFAYGLVVRQSPVQNLRWCRNQISNLRTLHCDAINLWWWSCLAHSRHACVACQVVYGIGHAATERTQVGILLGEVVYFSSTLEVLV
jgi:hypothetical protein